MIASAPFVSQEVIIRAYEAAAEFEAVVSSIPTVNPMRLRKGNRLEALDRSYDRSDILIVQTPQVFKYGILKQAFEQAYQEPFRDDSLVVEHMGKDIHVIDESRQPQENMPLINKKINLVGTIISYNLEGQLIDISRHPLPFPLK